MTRLILLVSLGIVLQLKAHCIHVNLQQALNRHLVEAVTQSLGSYQGYCMKLKLKNLSKDSLVVSIEAGRRLNSTDDKYQDILLVKEERLVLKAKEEKSVSLKGYCCQASHLCPNVNSQYSLNKMADSNLVLLARYLSANQFGQEAEQQAVWAISECRSAATIAALNDTLLQELREKVAEIKGEILPWYRLVSKRYVTRNGNIINMPYRLQGDLTYSSQEDDYVSLSVVNEGGVPVCLILTQWLPAKLNAIYKLDLPLAGLEKGKYKVELKTKQGSISERMFEL